MTDSHLMDLEMDSTQQEFNDTQNSKTSFENDNVDSYDKDSDTNSNQQDNLNSNNHGSVDDSYGQKNEHPNDDNEKGSFREFGDGNSQFYNNYGSDYRSGSNWNNSKGNEGGQFEAFANNNPKGSNHQDFNSPTNGGFKPQRSRRSNENNYESWNDVPQDSSLNLMNGPISQQDPSFGENQLPPFNEQDGNPQSGGPPTNKLSSLLQMPPVLPPNSEIPQGPPPVISGEVWIETKAGDGKSYNYNARTCKTTWDKPVGLNIINVIYREQVEHLGNSNVNNFAKPNEFDQIANDMESKSIDDKSHSNDHGVLMYPPNVGVPGQMMGPPPGMMPPLNFLPFGGPSSTGMPPPSFPQASPRGMMPRMELHSKMDVCLCAFCKQSQASSGSFTFASSEPLEYSKIFSESPKQPKKRAPKKRIEKKFIESQKGKKKHRRKKCSLKKEKQTILTELMADIKIADAPKVPLICKTTLRAIRKQQRKQLKQKGKQAAKTYSDNVVDFTTYRSE